jgi:hypothetical protein
MMPFSRAISASASVVATVLRATSAPMRSTSAVSCAVGSASSYEEVYLRAYGSVSEARASLDRKTPDHIYFNQPLVAAE